MEKERTGSLTLNKDDGSVIYVWLEKENDTIYMKSSTLKGRKDSYTDVNIYPSGRAYAFPSGSFESWEIVKT